MIDLERILVLGGSGMVGSQIPFGVKPSHAELDITDAESVARGFDTYKPVALLHLAGLIDVKRCEEEPEHAQRANIFGTRNVAQAAAKAGVPVIYLSTCMVFSGSKSSPYVETDIPDPLTVYGKTKRSGEEEILDVPRSLVVRTGWLFGGFDRDVKFVKRFIDTLKAGTPIRATSDRVGSPTYVPDLIKEIVRLMQEGKEGIFHVVNDGVASYLQVAEILKELTHSHSGVTGLSQAELNPSELPRGLMEGLVSKRSIMLRSYKEALADYVAALIEKGK